MDGTPIVSIASTSSLTRIAPSCETIPPPTFAATMNPKMNGTISRLTQNDEKSGPTMPAPTAWPIASAAMPQLAPAMNEMKMITRTEPATRRPIWRSTSAV
jgi:hypothetical protein